MVGQPTSVTVVAVFPEGADPLPAQRVTSWARNAWNISLEPGSAPNQFTCLAEAVPQLVESSHTIYRLQVRFTVVEPASSTSSPCLFFQPVTMPFPVTVQPRHIADAVEDTLGVTIVHDSSISFGWTFQAASARDAEDVAAAEFMFQGHVFRLVLMSPSAGADEPSPIKTIEAVPFDALLSNLLNKSFGMAALAVRLGLPEGLSVSCANGATDRCQLLLQRDERVSPAPDDSACQTAAAATKEFVRQLQAEVERIATLKAGTSERAAEHTVTHKVGSMCELRAQLATLLNVPVAWARELSRPGLTVTPVRSNKHLLQLSGPTSLVAPALRAASDAIRAWESQVAESVLPLPQRQAEQAVSIIKPTDYVLDSLPVLSSNGSSSATAPTTGSIGHLRFSIVLTDWKRANTQVLLNPANENLQNGGGLAALIEHEAGPHFAQDCQTLCGTVAQGSAKLMNTRANDGLRRLGFQAVVHAVAPVYRASEQAFLVHLYRSAIVEALTLADSHGHESLGIPMIGGGIFGWPLDRCATEMLQAIGEWCSVRRRSTLARLVLFDNRAEAVLQWCTAASRAANVTLDAPAPSEANLVTSGVRIVAMAESIAAAVADAKQQFASRASCAGSWRA